MRNSKLTGLLAAATITASAVQANAAVIASQGFEGTAAETWGYTVGGINGAVSNVDPGNDFPTGASRFRTGSYSFQQIDSNIDTAATSGSMTFDSLSVTGLTDVTVQLYLAAHGRTSGNALDTADLVQVFIALNGQDFGTTADLTVEGNANARWSYSSGTGVAEATLGTVLPNFKPGTGGGTRTTDGYSTLILHLPDDATSFAMKIVTTNNHSAEIWAIDDVTVSAVPEPASLSFIAAAGSLLLGRRRRRA